MQFFFLSKMSKIRVPKNPNSTRTHVCLSTHTHSAEPSVEAHYLNSPSKIRRPVNRRAINRVPIRFEGRVHPVPNEAINKRNELFLADTSKDLSIEYYENSLDDASSEKSSNRKFSTPKGDAPTPNSPSLDTIELNAPVEKENIKRNNVKAKSNQERPVFLLLFTFTIKIKFII